MNTKFFLLLIGAISLFLLPQLTHAQWTNDPRNGMVMVTSAIGTQDHVKLCSLESGNTLVAWTDQRVFPQMIYYQVLDLGGNSLLTDDGLPIVEGNWTTAWSTGGATIPDGSGGCIAVFKDNRDGTWDIYGQRFDPYGNPLWGPTGLPLVVWPEQEEIALYEVTYDSSGGFFIIWGQMNEGTSVDLYAQKFNRDAERPWGNYNGYGVPLSTALRNQLYPQAVPDYQGGLLVAWEDDRDVMNSYKLYFQHLDPDGSPLLTLNGQPVLHPQYGTQLGVGGLYDGFPDGQGGGMWVYFSSGINYARVIRIADYGRALWLWQASDPGGPAGPNAFLSHPVDYSVWVITTNPRLYRIDVDGNPLFGQGGIVTIDEYLLTPTSDGVITIGSRYSGQGSQVWARRLTMEGDFLWQSNVALGGNSPSGGGLFYAEASVPDGSDGAVVAFTDLRSYPDPNLAAQRVLSDGQLGNPPFTPPPKEYLPIGPIDDPSGPFKVTVSGDGVELNLPQAGWVKLELYDLLGRRVAVLRQRSYLLKGTFSFLQACRYCS